MAREVTLRMLFQYEASENLSPEETYNLFCKCFRPAEDDERVLGCGEKSFEDALPFIRDLFFGVTDNLVQVDTALDRASSNWRVDRMSRVDRNVMRLAVYEMLFRDDIPAKVSINEAIDLGKAYGTEESGAFINGVLDKVNRKLNKQREEEKQASELNS